jgi:tetratricopeptide (TPR) repeat protein
MKRDASAYVTGQLRIPRAENPSQVIARGLSGAKDKEAALWVRHGVYLRQRAPHLAGPPPLQPDPVPPHGDRPFPRWPRFFAGAPSQTFNHLLESLKEFPDPPRGRRLFILIGGRGVGKGHFFHALSYSSRLNALRKKLGNALSTSTPWPAISFNCGVSHEVTSIFDFLPDLLLQAAGQFLEGGSGDTAAKLLALRELKGEACALGADRLRRMSHVLGQLRSVVPDGMRIIVAFSGMSVLVDREGGAKNAQLQRLFLLLFGEASAGAPIDLLLVTDDDKLPRWLSRNWKVLAFPRLTDLPYITRSPRRRHEMEQIRAKLPKSEPDAPRTGPCGDQVYVHILIPTRASIMATACFPSVALVIALDEVFHALDAAEAENFGLSRNFEAWVDKLPVNQFQAETAAWIRQQVVEVLDGSPAPAAQALDEFKDNFPRMLAYMALCVARQGGTWQSGIAPIWEQLLRPAPVPPDWSVHPDLINRLGKAVDTRMRALYEACAGSRYGFTILMATALQYLVSGPAAPTAERVRSGAIECTGFLGELQSKLERTAEAQRVETIFETMMDVLAVLDRPQAYRAVPDSLDRLHGCKRLLDLQKAILWELAVTGQPVSVEVVARSPSILRFCREFEQEFAWPKKGTDMPEEWTDTVKQCLALLEDRCLVFRVRPRAPSLIAKAVNGEVPASLTEQGGDLPGDSEARYSLHTQLQRHVFRRLHAPLVEFPEVDQFALTLFANQPNDVPRLTADAHHDLYSTVAALIKFPDDNMRSRRPPLRPWPELPALPKTGVQPDLREKALLTLNVRTQLLRSALGMVRSVYSLSTLVKFTPEPPPEGVPAGSDAGEEGVRDDGALGGRPAWAHEPGRGAGHRFGDGPLLERHRFLIHWMIRQAGWHDDDAHDWGLRPADDEASDGTPATDTETPAPLLHKPFYDEELVWLYNEAGVLSYAQGRLLDANAFYFMALNAVRRIEPDVSGALHVRIALNTAMTYIDRGRLTLAEPMLSRIRGIVDEDPAVLSLATGLLGLVEHVRGRYRSAKQYYEEALQGASSTSDRRSCRRGLIELRCSRAASIISRLQGDLHRALGRLNRAEQMLHQSATLAIEAGHEDIRHRTRLSTLKLDLKKSGVAVDGDPIHKELDIIEDYANQMGMSRLQCEVDLVRAQLRQMDGDLQAAASVASRGLAIASANELTLLKTNFLLRLAEIFERRGKLEECKAVLSEAFDIAREAEYHSARERGQRLYARIARRLSA